MDIGSYKSVSEVFETATTAGIKITSNDPMLALTSSAYVVTVTAAQVADGVRLGDVCHPPVNVK